MSKIKHNNLDYYYCQFSIQRNCLFHGMCIKSGELARGDNNGEIRCNLNKLQQITFFTFRKTSSS